MTFRDLARPAAALVLVMAVAGCAERAGGAAPGAASPAATLPDDADTLVLRVEYTGGFVTPEITVGRLPIASLYADGRLIVEGPMAAIYPAFAWPNVQVLDLGPERVAELAEHALDAGVGETADLGTPPVADAPSTRITLVTADESYVREVYALTEADGSGLTEEQVAARAELRDLVTEITDLAIQEAGDAPPRSWEPAAVAAIARPWTDPEDGLDHQEAVWPGPALPGEPVGPLPDLGCALATGDQAVVVRKAAANANAATPWVTPDGGRWSVLFRPLLPDETGCADLA